MSAVSELGQKVNYDLPTYDFNKDSSKNSDSTTASSKGVKNTYLYGEYLSNENLTLNYTSKDGDSFSFNYEKVEAMRMGIGLENVESVEKKDNESQSEYSKKITDIFNSIKQNIIKELMNSIGKDGLEKDSETNVDSINTQDVSDAEIPGLPEYWNAENTSQRIFEFSTSFFSVSNQSAEEYYLTMKSAIEEGYGQAVKEIGDVSSAVSALSEKTLSLSLEKLANWAREQGVDVDALNPAI